MITTPLNPTVLNTIATKTIRCVCDKKPKTFFFNTASKLWQCSGCGRSFELTATEIKKYTFQSNTALLVNYLLALGYPVVDAGLEMKPAQGKLMTGTVTLVDTNSTYDPKKPRRVLEIHVQTIGKQVDYTIYARKFTTKGKATGKTTFMCDDLMKLGADIQTQYEIADLVVNTLGVNLKHPHFDVKEKELQVEVADALYRLNEADAALTKYQKGGRKC